MSPVLTVFVYALLTAIATWLGAIPFIFKKDLSRTWVAKANAVAAALMITASFGLIYEWIKLKDRILQADTPFFHKTFLSVEWATRWVLLGIALGLWFILICDHILSKYHHLEVHHLKGADAKKVILIMAIMTLHSFTEGVAVGVSFWPSMWFWIFIALAIAIHNIPEWLAISTVLVPKGYKRYEAIRRSIFSSLPQPLMALPAFFFVNWFTPFLPVGLGFAAGAMIWMALSELLPDALDNAPKGLVATIATIAIISMIFLQQLLGQ